MDILDLEQKCEDYKKLEGRASFYDLAAEIVKEKPLHASVILLATWNVGRFRFFASNSENLIALGNAIKETKGLFSQLENKKFLLTDFNQIRNAVTSIYDKFSNVKGVEYTGTSKIMHLFNRDLFVMWDSHIRKEYGIMTSADDYLEFLKKMQIKFSGIEWISNEKTFSKAIDEYNYVTISYTALKRQGKKRDYAI